MIQIFIWGAGKSSDFIFQSLKWDQVKLLGYIDNNRKLEGTSKNGYTINRPHILEISEFDYIIIGSMSFRSVCADLSLLNIPGNKIISFFDREFIYSFENEIEIFQTEWRLRALDAIWEHQLQRLQKDMSMKWTNSKYELKDILAEIHLPQIAPQQAVIDGIIQQNKSLARFGDGEFEIIFNRNRADFQKTSAKLSSRLREILQSKESNLMVAIADNYGSLDKYTEDAAYGIRSYLTEDVRKQHMTILEAERVYYDTYVTRPYMIYKDKKTAGERFKKFQEIWAQKKVTIIEGEGTRVGIGNDLLENAIDIRRIIAPSQDAFSVYDDILKAALEEDTNRLLLIALGPTATVLAYDLCRSGYQAIDIGHIDIEYEWFLRGCLVRENIPTKSVNEVRGGYQAREINDLNYKSQIVQIV